MLGKSGVLVRENLDGDVCTFRAPSGSWISEWLSQIEGRNWLDKPSLQRL